MRRKQVAWLAGGVLLLAVVLITAISLVQGEFLLGRHLRLEVEGETEMEIDAFSDYTDAGATAEYGKTDLTDQIQVEGSVDTQVPGDYTITYAVSYNGKSRTAERLVHVLDREAPVIELAGETEMVVSLRELYEEPGYTATDRCDGDVTAAVTVTEEEQDDVIVLTYEVSDAAGNTATAERHVEIKDVVAPVITISGSEHVYVALGGVYEDGAVTAEDDADGDLTAQVQREGEVDTAKAGTYTVKYVVSDQAGNQAEAKRWVTVYRDVTDNKDRIYLTFDDGPSSEVTPRVLDILKKYQIKATFFILNYSDSDKPVLQRMINEGHTIGIHGYSHDYATIYASDEAFLENINKLQEKLVNDFGYHAQVIRFPGGSSNTISRNYSNGIMSRLSKKVVEAGYEYVDWNVSSGDANGNHIAKDTLYSNTIKDLYRGRNNVVLMHDTNYKDTTADVLPEIISYGLENGFVFLPITGDTPPCHHGINN